jgi:hypothetical protein
LHHMSTLLDNLLHLLQGTPPGGHWFWLVEKGGSEYSERSCFS